MTSLQLLDPRSIWVTVWLRCRGAGLIFTACSGRFGGWQRLFRCVSPAICTPDSHITFAGWVCEIEPGTRSSDCVRLPSCPSWLIHFFNQAQPPSSALWASSSTQCQRQWCITELEMLALSGGGTRPYPMTQAGVQRWGEGLGGTVGTSESSRMWISATAFNMLDSNESMLAFPERPSVVRRPILSSLN